MTETAWGEESCNDCGRVVVTVEGHLVINEDGEEVFEPLNAEDSVCDSCLARRGRRELADETRAMAKQFKNAAESFGWDARLTSSNSSEACYVTLRGAGQDLRIRFAAHTARPTYDREFGVPDFEVGPESNQESNGDLAAAIRWIRGFGRQSASGL